MAALFGLAALRTAMAATTDDPDWPMVMHDAQRTGFNPAMPASLTPPLGVRWVAKVGEVRFVPGFRFPEFSLVGDPVGAKGEIFVSLGSGESVKRLNADNGLVNAVFRHPQVTRSAFIPVVFSGPLVLKDRVVWGLAGSARGLAALPLNFTASSDLLFTNAGPIGVTQVSNTSPAAAEGIIVAVDVSGKIFAIKTDGAPVWSFQTGGAVLTPPTIAEALHTVYAGSLDQKFRALSLFSGTLFWEFLAAGPLTRMASTDGERVYVPSFAERLLYALDAKTGSLEWTTFTNGLVPLATPAVAGNKVIWNTSEAIVALNSDTGVPLWSTLVSLGGVSLTVGNGFVWGAGVGRMVAVRLNDGGVAQNKEIPLIRKFSGAPMLLNTAGGELIVNANFSQLAAFANRTLPLAPQNLKVVAKDLSLVVSWGQPPPVPEDPPPSLYLITRQGGYVDFTPPPANQVEQHAIFNKQTREVRLLPPGTTAPVSGPEVLIRLPDNRTTPPSQVIFTVPLFSPLGDPLDPVLTLEDSSVNPQANYRYQIFVVDVEGNLSPPTPVTNPATILTTTTGLPGRIEPGGDWLEDEFNSDHLGWNPRERLSWGKFNSGVPDDIRALSFPFAYRRAFSFAGVEAGVQFTEPVISQGSVYVGGSDGRLYALNAQTGKLRWWVATGGPIRFPPAILQVRGTVQTRSGSFELIKFELIDVASDDGHLYTISIKPGARLPTSVERESLGGVPLGAPLGGSVLVQGENDDVLIHGPLQSFVVAPGATPDSAFFGPRVLGRGRVVGLNFGGKALLLVPGVAGVIDPPFGGDLNSALVRSSGVIYKDGHELLVAGFNEGWFALVERKKEQPKWVPLLQSTAGFSAVGGIVTAFPFDPGTASDPFWKNQEVSFSFLEASSHHRFARIVEWNFDRRRLEEKFTCPVGPSPGDAGVATWLPVETREVIRIPEYIQNLSTGEIAIDPRTLDPKFITTEIVPGTGRLVMGCGAPSPMPVKQIFGSTSAGGFFTAKSGYHVVGAGGVSGWIPSRGFRYTGQGPVVVAEGWTAPLAPRAIAKARLFADGSLRAVTRVNVLWTPPPGFLAEGYEIFRAGPREEFLPFRLVGTVLGREMTSFIDNFDDLPNREIFPTELGSVFYFIRAFNNSLDPRVGANSMVARLELPKIDTLSVEMIPPVIFPDELMIITIRTTLTNTVTGIGQPIPGVEVLVKLSAGAGVGRIKRSLEDPGSTSFLETVVTDQEGKVQLLYQPDPATMGKFRVQVICLVSPPFSEQAILVTSGDAFVVDRASYRNLAVTGSIYYPANLYNNNALLIQQQFGTLTGPSIIDPSHPLRQDISGALSRDLIDQIRFFGSERLLCQGLACSVPVNTYSGAMALQVTDLSLPSRGLNLAWVRTYSNFRPELTPQGRGWSCIYASFLETTEDNSILFHRWDGSVFRYVRRPDGSYQSPAGFFDKLTRREDGSVTMRSREGNVMEFDAEGQLVTLRDRGGNAQRLHHLGGRLVQILDEAGKFLKLEYDDLGRVASVRDSTGRIVRYEYNELDQLIRVTRPGEEIVTYVYDADHHLTELSDPRLPAGSKRGKFTYDNVGRVAEAFDGEGQLRNRFAYELLPDGTTRTQITETCCGPRVDEYDQRGILTAQVDALGHRTEFVFDEQLRLVSQTDRNGNTTRVEYNGQGRPVRITDALGNVTRYGYEPTFGFVTEVVDALGRRTRFSYDGSGNLVRQVDAAGGVWRQAFDGFGQVRELTDVNGHTTRFDYDEVGNLLALIDPLDRTTRFEYDIRQRIVRRIDAKGRATEFGYNERDLKTETRFSDGALSRFAYDAFNRLKRQTDPNGNSMLSAYDRNDQLVQSIDANGGITRYKYDVQGNLTSVTDANGQETRYEYDLLNRMVKVTDPLGKIQRFGYDSEGNRIERIDGNNVRTILAYDARNRLLSRNFPDGTKEEFAYDAAGQLTVMKNPTVEQRYTYDSLGRVTEHRYVTFGKTLRYEWDPVGNRLAIRFRDGNNIRYRYDAANQLIGATDSQAGDFELGYDANGNKTFLTYPNGLMVRYTYDQRDRLLTMVTERERGQAPVVQVPDFTYGYDSVGNRTFMERSDEGKTTYNYDHLYQLTLATFPDGGFQAFTYDPVGNRLRLEEKESGKIKNTTYEYNAANELIRLIRDFQDLTGPPPHLFVGPGAPSGTTLFITNFIYDGNGSRIQMDDHEDPSTQYLWDFRERLIKVSEGKMDLQANAYDPFNHRTILREGKAETTFLYDGIEINRNLVEFSPKGQAPLRRHLWLGGQKVGTVLGGQLQFLMMDAIGSVVAITNHSGAVIQRAFYKPFGEVSTRGSQAPSTDRAGFVGSLGVQHDGSTGLYYMWNRFYEADVGMFLTVDPTLRNPLSVILLPSGGSFIRQNDLFTPYRYVINNPVNSTDPSGLTGPYCIACLVACGRIPPCSRKLRIACYAACVVVCIADVIVPP